MADITYTVNQDNPENISGFEQFSQADTQLVNKFEINSLFIPTKNYIELHILDLVDEILQSDYNYISYKELGNAQSAGREGASILTINPVEDIEKYGYDTGDVKLLYHFLNDLYTPDNKQANFFIEEISPDRTELKLQTFDLAEEEVVRYTQEIKNKLTTQSYFSEFRLNFKNNNLIIGVNIDTLIENGNSVLVVKLYEPLPIEFEIKNTLSIVETVADSAAYIVDSNIDSIPETLPYLRPANFNLELTDVETVPTAYLSYNELFSYPVNNTNSQIYSLLNEKGVELSINHTDYNDFIHFSSAYERLLNFKYKLGLIENYSSSLAQIGNATSQSLGITGSTYYYENLTQGILDNFDHYERFLYYESSSYSWPKSNNTKPYKNVPSSNNTAVNWYANQLAVANNYDLRNLNAVVNSIPSFLREDPNNTNYITFVHMIGQHFDNLWIYGKGVSDKYDADNRLDFGVSKDLVAEVLKNFGVKLYTSNKSIEDLFTSFIGQAYQSGSEIINTYVTGSVTGSNASIQPSSFDNYQREVYKRMYHNLPLLLKSKGTERGLRALINCFGIPSDILDIKVYGGRNINERPFYGDYRYYTSSLDKVRLDNTGSIITGSTLSQYTSIVKREYKYTDDLHPIEIGFSPTDNVDNYIISKSLSTGSLSTFNIDEYLGDPRNLYLDNYYNIGPSSNITGSLSLLTDQIMSGSSAYDVQDFVRLIKFFDNTIFKIVKDFIPARSTADTGIIIKPHLLQRNKAKSVLLSGSRPEYTGSIDTAFIEGSSGGVYTSIAQGTVEGELNTSYTQLIQTPFGVGSDNRHTHQEASYDGELRNSSILVTNGELNSANLFKTPTFFTNTFDVNRWINAEGLCILNPYSTYLNNYGGIFYSSSNNTFYLDSGSWNSTALYSGLSQISMVYQITSSNIPTSSFSFPFNTNNYANYTTHSLTASNSGVTGSCTSSVNIQIAVCDIDQTGFFRSSVKETDIYNITSWFVTGSQNPSSNVTLSIINNTTAGSVYNGLLSGATAISFGGSQNDTYTLTVRDIQIPLTCTFNYPIVAGLCSVVTSSLYVNEIVIRGIGRWSTNLFLATDNVIIFGTPNEYNYGLARFFTGINPDNEIYRVRVYDPLDLGTVLDTQNFGNIYPPDSTTLYTTGTGTFLANVFGNYPLYEYFWYYGPTNIPQAPAGMPNIGGNVALFKVKYSQQYLNDNPQVQADNNGIYAETFFIDVFAVESSECTPKVSLRPPIVPDASDFDGIDGDPCCFVANTLVTLPDYTQIRIDNIKVGDTVLSYNEETGEILTSIVIKVSTPVKRDIVKHTLSNSIEIEAARNHPFWVVGKGWSSYAPSITKKDHDMDVEQLEQGDILLTQEGTEVVLVKMEFDENREYEVVYNIALDGHYTYYANSILVHNKTPEQVILCP
jgi:hypothetical protein